MYTVCKNNAFLFWILLNIYMINSQNLFKSDKSRNFKTGFIIHILLNIVFQLKFYIKNLIISISIEVFQIKNEIPIWKSIWNMSVFCIEKINEFPINRYNECAFNHNTLCVRVSVFRLFQVFCDQKQIFQSNRQKNYFNEMKKFVISRSNICYLLHFK